MNWPTKLLLLFVFNIAVITDGQSQIDAQTSAQQTQVRGFWVDPATGLMWAGKDNGLDVTWKNAVKYCRGLRIAGNSDWRLASLKELAGIYDKDAKAPGLMGLSGKEHAASWRVKGNLFLTGIQWSSNQKIDDRGRPSGWVWTFNFNDGRPFDGDEVTFFSDKRALCVRDSGKSRTL